MSDHKIISTEGLPSTVAQMRAVLDATDPSGVSIGLCGNSIATVDFKSLQTLRLLGERFLATLPNTKMVEVWRVEYASNNMPLITAFPTRERAENWANGTAQLAYIACARVTGPHKQEVPA